jgi:hypothetical protein
VEVFDPVARELGLAAVRARRGDALGAPSLAGAAEAALTPPIIDEQAEIRARLEAQFIEPCRQTLDHADWKRATEAGAAMPLSEAIEVAPADPTPPSPDATRWSTPP